jgi:hypothetical protein
MDAWQIRLLRLSNTGLNSSAFKTPTEVVEHLCAVQAQDYVAAKWAIGLRLQKTTDQIVEQAFNEGKILRTHVMRPTWHFVTPQDIKWLLELTAPQVKKLLASSDKKLGITKELLNLSQKTCQEALEGNKSLTRTELAEELQRRGISAKGQLLAHILVHIELDALICSGPVKGKQLTYCLLDERAPNAEKLSREESLKKLSLKYFSGHGPAQVKDFAWWSGLSLVDAKQGLKLSQEMLEQETVDTKTYWFTQPKNHSNSKEQSAFLLSIYDEYTIGYTDRSVLSDERIVEKLIAMGNALTAVMVFEGKIVGTWSKRKIKKNLIEVRLSPFKALENNAQNAFKDAAELYGQFFGCMVNLV